MVGEYAPGMRVYIRDEEWLVRKVEKNSSKRTTLHCIGISTLVRDRETKFLADLENVRRVDPLDTRFIADETSQYMAGGLFLESAWRQKQPMDHYIHMGGRAVMNLLPYQLEPAFKALQRPRKRILIADAVGLGKTLEAGILMSELIARGNGKRILVVTAKSMMKQFQKEMWNRFTIPLTRLDSTRIHRLRSELPTNCNPFFYHNRVIISIDTLKRDLEYRTYLENAYWDIIVIDEAQNVAERGLGEGSASSSARRTVEPYGHGRHAPERSGRADDHVHRAVYVMQPRRRLRAGLGIFQQFRKADRRSE